MYQKDNFIYATNIQIVRNATIDYTLTNGYTGGSAVYSNDVYGWRTHIYNNLKEGDIIKWYEGGSVIKKPYAIFLNIEQYVYNSNNDNGFGQTEYTLTFNLPNSSGSFLSSTTPIKFLKLVMCLG